MTKSSFKSKTYASKEILEIVHTDLCGPIEVQSYRGDKYIMLLVDDYSRMMTVMFLKQKSDAFQMFKWYLARVEKETGKSLKCLRSDRGGEFTSNEFEIFCKERGIKRQTSAPRTPAQNGIAERRNRSILDCARTLMMEKNVALKYWREAVSTAVYTLNRVQVKKGTHSTPFELWYGYPPNVKYFKIFGSKCYIQKDDRSGKFDAKSTEGIFLGYSTRSKAYKCLNIDTNKVVESANVNFDEYAEVQVESTKEPEQYKSFIYFYEGMPNEEITANPVGNQQQISITAESQLVNAEH
jgi:hypothetical protein